MERAKRNRRQRGIGAAPVPTPTIMVITIVALEQDGTGAKATGTLKYGGLLDVEVQPDDLSNSGIKPEFVLFASAGTAIVASSIEITEDPELFIFFENTGAISPGSQVVTSRGFDPSIRGNKGAFTNAFYTEI